MYYDPSENRYYATRRDYERMQLLTKLRRGELREIQGFSKYTITPDGQIINISRVRPVKPYDNPRARRLTIGLINDAGEQKTLGLARLICSHFYVSPEGDQYYDVVHVDGDYRNINPSNLKWVARWRRHARQENYGIDIS